MEQLVNFLRVMFGSEQPTIYITRKQYREYLERNERLKNIVRTRQEKELRQRQKEELKQIWAKMPKPSQDIIWED